MKRKYIMIGPKIRKLYCDISMKREVFNLLCDSPVQVNPI